jgi:hypothetical protein
MPSSLTRCVNETFDGAGPHSLCRLRELDATGEIVNMPLPQRDLNDVTMSQVQGCARTPTSPANLL